MFNQRFSCAGLLVSILNILISITGLSPSMANLPRLFFCQYIDCCAWALPISLAATIGISFDFFSCRYLDVSVPYVRSVTLCIQITVTLRPGSPLRTPTDQCALGSSPWLFAAYYVLHRLLLPRHPPYALILLFIHHEQHLYMLFICLCTYPTYQPNISIKPICLLYFLYSFFRISQFLNI